MLLLVGNVDLDHAASAGGSYIGVEPMGLFWSMKPSSANQVSEKTGY